MLRASTKVAAKSALLIVRGWVAAIPVSVEVSVSLATRNFLRLSATIIGRAHKCSAPYENHGLLN